MPSGNTTGPPATKWRRKGQTLKVRVGHQLFSITAKQGGRSQAEKKIRAIGFNNLPANGFELAWSACHYKRVENLTPQNASTGPTSPEGKARSARNAEKHGMYGNAVLLHQESAEEFAALRDDYYCQFLPVTRAESDLVDRMIAATWRLRRLIALESAAMDHKMDTQRSELDATYSNLDPETRAHFAFEELAGEGVTLATYARFQSAQLRQYDRALRSLMLLREACPPKNTKI